jgi:hypothetical protein
LNYKAIAYGSPQKESIKPSSGNGLAIAPYILSGSPIVPAEITINFPGSKTTSFDMKSTAHACAAATQNGFIVPAVSYTILYTGTKVSGEMVGFESSFKVTGLLNFHEIAPFGVEMEEKTFPANFTGLKNMKVAISKSVVSKYATQIGFDDVKYTAYVEE